MSCTLLLLTVDGAYRDAKHFQCQISVFQLKEFQVLVKNVGIELYG